MKFLRKFLSLVRAFLKQRHFIWQSCAAAVAAAAAAAAAANFLGLKNLPFCTSFKTLKLSFVKKKSII